MISGCALFIIWGSSLKLLLFYSAEKYFQSVQALLFLFRRIAILSLPKEKASWQLKALFGFCWITIHPLLPRPSGRPTGLTVVLNIIAIGGLSISFIPVATIWEPLLFYSSCTDKESHVLLEIIVHNPVVIDISTLSIPSAIHEAVPSVPSFCLEQRTHIRIFLIFPLSIYLKTRR